MERGVIASPGIMHRIPAGLRMERSISPSELNFYTLYWDHVVIPGNNLIYVGVPNEDELMKAGVLSRPRVQFSGTYAGDQVTDAVLGCQALVAAELTKSSDEDWVIHQFGGDIVLPPTASSEVPALRLALASVLPVPPADVNTDDVLEFKITHRDMLRTLHDVLDNIYLEILQSPDQSLASRKAVSTLKDEIRALNEVTRKRNWPTFDLSIEFNLTPKDVVLALFGGAAVTATTGLPLAASTLASAVGTLLQISVSKSRNAGEAKRSHRLAYLTSATKAGIVQ